MRKGVQKKPVKKKESKKKDSVVKEETPAQYYEIQALFNIVAELQENFDRFEKDREVHRLDRKELDNLKNEHSILKSKWNEVSEGLLSLLSKEQMEAAEISCLEPELYALEWVKCCKEGKIGYNMYKSAGTLGSEVYLNKVKLEGF